MADQHLGATDEQVRDFEARGWAFIPQLMEKGAALRLGEAAQALMADATPQTLHSFHGKQRDEKYQRIYRDRYNLVRESQTFRDAALAPRIGQVVADLLGVRRVRFLKDTLLVKPGAADTLATPVHQDLPFWPIDRSAGVTVWIALRPVRAEMGSLVFYDGSHRWGLLGSHLAPSPPLEERFPRLKTTPLTAPMAFEPGDATIHEAGTVHTAGPNHTGVDRWAWTVCYVDADALYTGAAHPVTDGLGLTPARPFEHERFPIVGA